MTRWRTSTQLGLLSSSNALQAGFSAVAALMATRMLGPNDRGLMVLGLTIGGLFGGIGGLGTGAAFRIALPQWDVAGTRETLASAYTWCSIGGAVPAVAAAVGVTALSASLVDSGLGTGLFLGGTAVFTFSYLMLTQVVEAWFADGRFHRGSLAAAAMNGAGLAGVLVGLALSTSAAVVLLAQGIGTGVAATYEIRALARVGLLDFSRPALRVMGALLRKGVPALGLTVGIAVAFRADRYLLGTIAGAGAVGIYSLAATFSETARLLPGAIGQLLFRDIAAGEVDARAARASRSARLGIVCSAAVALPVGLAGWYAVGPVFGADFLAARPLLVVLLVAEVCFAPYAVASRGLMGGGWVQAACVLGIVGGVSAVACYAVAAHTAGAMGTAVASVLIYAGLSVAAWQLLRLRLRRDHPVADPPRLTEESHR